MGQDRKSSGGPDKVVIKLRYNRNPIIGKSYMYTYIHLDLYLYDRSIETEIGVSVDGYQKNSPFTRRVADV